MTSKTRTTYLGLMSALVLAIVPSVFLHSADFYIIKTNTDDWKYEEGFITSDGLHDIEIHADYDNMEDRTGHWVSTDIYCKADNDDGWLLSSEFRFSFLRLDDESFPPIDDSVRFNFRSGSQKHRIQDHDDEYYFYVEDQDDPSFESSNHIYDRELFTDIVLELFVYGKLEVEVVDTDTDETHEVTIWALPNPHSSGPFTETVAKCSNMRTAMYEYINNMSQEVTTYSSAHQEKSVSNEKAMHQFDDAVRAVEALKALQSDEYPSMRHRLLKLLQEN